MSKSLDPARYPTAYMDFAGAFEAAPKKVHRLRAPSRDSAVALRLDLYGFQGALRATAPHDYPNFIIARMFLDCKGKGKFVKVVHPDHEGDTAHDLPRGN